MSSMSEERRRNDKFEMDFPLLTAAAWDQSFVKKNGSFLTPLRVLHGAVRMYGKYAVSFLARLLRNVKRARQFGNGLRTNTFLNPVVG